ncbi:MAG: type I-D CRISPR-associated protein Cas5/Csc1 [Microcoleus sp. PH2017_15_JOR_U_A]|uniref:type I-D CRISPR-associated protein Cas5/Csc1 n=1 Tax=unclassified Microcoleus TaxID=2642155 RepID=UPI001D66FD52|nr:MULTISPECIES: type I-D CRISPR-associated protein Cas5/Csc1 [unclassified Microcoleus]MCC3473759.1 type I-D CRISPR-associated protein Cas5/Csc1 [Microcoleus sp. PH2017_13_LAR_U_A]MCC3486202.1 type I-D CRISPR-associated protein Cas5/Csc1 [Microcoleus sp. PH2017_14_LAR_D_A]MCC3498168.1 type I-D CRISPR-associated protein Cas5/Csc1 [Microcoleus sp. PH2017_15_JOR_U_A]MCC3598771.1 type I-D CRISPR-associated protein Cas5/Csc1 [Microcoleus sp. PH2017_26_ELK_O_A]MCC3623763.1 type I-D CRISPR-associate
MAFIYRCQIELHDSLYFATREIGRLYETEPVIHNYALCYALGLVDSAIYSTTVSEEHSYRYFCPEQIPKYEQHLTALNQQGIYVTPGRSISHSSTLNTWKYANNNYHVEMEKTQKNIPSFGRTKEIAPESKFEFFIISEKSLKLAKWIRLGKWMSKAELKIQEQKEVKRSQSEADVIFPYLLNPLDVMFSHQVISYDVVNMPPVSLIQNVKMLGRYYEFEKLKIPGCMEYRFRAD